MFRECANPACAKPFAYRKGRLFRFHESHPRGEKPTGMHSVRHFWLCEQCSRSHCKTMPEGLPMARKATSLWLFALAIPWLVLSVGCGGGVVSTVNNQSPPNPIPTISSLSPNSAAAGSAAFTLTIIGTNFVAGALVNFGGAAPSTTFVNSTQLTVAISAATIGIAGTVGVTVINPAPGGGTSNDVNFTITNPTNPGPMIYFLDPSGAAVGGPAFTLVVSGSDYLASSIVQWNGSDRPTTFVNSTQLSAQISASDISATGIAAVTVFTPTPGGGTSNSFTFTIARGGVSPQSIAVDPTGKFAYVANSASNNVSMYTIDGTTGALTPIGLIPAGSGPVSIAVHPTGKFVYVANESILNDLTSSVSMYTINPATGAMTSIGLPVATADLGARSVAVDPTGKFAYVANAGSDPGPTFCGSVTIFDIDATTGALTSMGTVVAPGAPAPGSCSPWSVAVDPTGKFAYVANEGGFTPTSISMFRIDATTGALTSLGLIAAGGRAISVAVAPSGNFVYAADGGNDSGGVAPGVNVSMYTINTSTGALTSTGTITAGLGPVSIAIDPFGKFAYVANSASNNVSMYTIDGTTGALTSIGTIAAGLSPTSITVHPSGKFAYVTNSGSNNVSMYTIDPATGALSLIGTVGT